MMEGKTLLCAQGGRNLCIRIKEEGDCSCTAHEVESKVWSSIFLGDRLVRGRGRLSGGAFLGSDACALCAPIGDEGACARSGRACTRRRCWCMETRHVHAVLLWAWRLNAHGSLDHELERMRT